MKLLKLSLLSLILAVPSLSFAAGGNDPIIGIDIIILKDPSSQPIADFSFSETEMNQYNALEGEDRPAYLSKVIVPKLERMNKKYNYAINWDPIITKGVEQQWCQKIRCDAKTTVVIQLNIPENLRESDVKFTLASKQDAMGERRIIRLAQPMNIKVQPLGMPTP